MSNVDFNDLFGESFAEANLTEVAGGGGGLAAPTIDMLNNTMALDRIRAWLNPENYPAAYKSARATRNSLLFAFYTTIVFVSLFGNLSVCYVIAKRRRMQTSTNLLMANLAVSDLFMTIVTIPFTITRLLLNSWPFGFGLCVLVPLVQVTSVYVSTLTMTVIAIDRYQAIINPLDKRLSTHVSIKLIIFVIWTVSALFSAPNVVFNQVVDVIDHVRRCRVVYPEPALSYRRFITLFTFLSQYLIPLSVTSFAYIRISRFIWYKLNNPINNPMGGQHYSVAEGAAGETNCSPEASSSYQHKLPAAKANNNNNVNNNVNNNNNNNKVLTENNIRQLNKHCYQFNVNRFHERSRRKSIKMLAIVVAVFAICWLPLNLYHLNAEFSSNVIGQNVFFICHWFAMSSVCYNPFIYFWLNRQYREEIQQMVCCHDKMAHTFSSIDERKRLNANFEMSLKRNHQNQQQQQALPPPPGDNGHVHQNGSARQHKVLVVGDNVNKRVATKDNSNHRNKGQQQPQKQAVLHSGDNGQWIRFKATTRSNGPPPSSSSGSGGSQQSNQSADKMKLHRANAVRLSGATSNSSND